MNYLSVTDQELTTHPCNFSLNRCSSRVWDLAESHQTQNTAEACPQFPSVGMTPNETEHAPHGCSHVVFLEVFFLLLQKYMLQFKAVLFKQGKAIEQGRSQSYKGTADHRRHFR